MTAETSDDQTVVDLASEPQRLDQTARWAILQSANPMIVAAADSGRTLKWGRP